MINRVVLVGRLTKDVEVRKTPSNLSVASFTVACDRRGARGQDGQQQADFINCVAWRQTADFLGQYARKGALVGVDGRIQTRSYDNRDGQKVYVTEVLADSVQLLESRAQSEARSQTTGYQNSYQNSGYQSGGYQDSYQPSYSQPAPQQPARDDSGLDFAGSSLDISSDDLPF